MSHCGQGRGGRRAKGEVGTEGGREREREREREEEEGGGEEGGGEEERTVECYSRGGFSWERSFFSLHPAFLCSLNASSYLP
jgi:hypothetical protein